MEAQKYSDNWSLDALATPRVNSFFNQIERLPDVKLTGFRQQVLELRELGLAAVEAVYPTFTAARSRQMRELARTAGLAISGHSNPIVRKCRIHHGRHDGVYVFDGGAGVLEDCDVSSASMWDGRPGAERPAFRRF